jgi:hypothetical protein
MPDHAVVSREEWVVARNELLEKEKQLTRLKDELSHERRRLRCVKVEKSYLDLTQCRDENGPHHNLMDWVRHHEKYGFDGFVDATSLYRTGAVTRFISSGISVELATGVKRKELTFLVDQEHSRDQIDAEAAQEVALPAIPLVVLWPGEFILGDERLQVVESAFILFSLVSKDGAAAVLQRDDVQIGLAVNGRDPDQASCWFSVGDVDALWREFDSKCIAPGVPRPGLRVATKPTGINDEKP